MCKGSARGSQGVTSALCRFCVKDANSGRYHGQGQILVPVLRLLCDLGQVSSFSFVFLQPQHCLEALGDQECHAHRAACVLASYPRILIIRKEQQEGRTYLGSWLQWIQDTVRTWQLWACLQLGASGSREREREDWNQGWAETLKDCFPKGAISSSKVYLHFQKIPSLPKWRHQLRSKCSNTGAYGGTSLS